MKKLDELHIKLMKAIIKVNQETNLHIGNVYIEPEKTIFHFFDDKKGKKEYHISNESWNK